MSPPDPTKSALARSSYHSPYSRSGAPGPHPNADIYAPLRAKALSTLEAMGFNPDTMVEHAVSWAPDQDPYGHVSQHKFAEFAGTSWYRQMELYGDTLTKEEYLQMATGKGVAVVIHKYEINIKRQVRYPDALIAAVRTTRIEPSRIYATTVLYSLQQQAIVCEVTGWGTYIDMKTGRPTDIRKRSETWSKVFDFFTARVKRANDLKEKWDKEHAKKGRASKI